MNDHVWIISFYELTYSCIKCKISIDELLKEDKFVRDWYKKNILSSSSYKIARLETFFQAINDVYKCLSDDELEIKNIVE